MKLDVTAKGFLPANLWETTTFDDVISQAKNYLPSKSPAKITPPTLSKIEVAKSTIFQFYRAYTKNQKHGEIEILQKFLQGE